MGLRSGSWCLALCAFLIGTASAWALAPHDKAVGVQAEQKTDRAIHAETQAQDNKASSTPTPAFVTPAQTAGEQGNAGQGGKNGEQEGTEFWPTLLGYKFKITDSLIAISTLVLTIFTGLLWRSTEKLWKAGEDQRTLSEKIAADQSGGVQHSLRIANINAVAALRAAEVAERTLIASNRAWIEAELVIGELSQFRIENKIPLLQIGVRVKNVGNAPASNVFIKCWLVCLRNNINPVQEHIQIVSRYRERRDGYVLFPDRDLNSIFGGNTIVAPAGLEYEKPNDITIRPDCRGIMTNSFYVGGAIYYSFESDKTNVHESTFMYEVLRKNPLGSIDSDATFIPHQGLQILRIGGDGRTVT